jgi:hypothetical protein
MGSRKLPKEKGPKSKICRGSIGGTPLSLPVELVKATSYGDIFSLVKKTVKITLGLHRMGLMLFLGNLPTNICAFHPMGTNDIVINRRFLGQIKNLKQKSHIFTILLHEYLHALGFFDEREVRRLTYRICQEIFGKNHETVEAALSGPWANISEEDYEEIRPDLQLELVRDFERIDIGYII